MNVSQTVIWTVCIACQKILSFSQDFLGMAKFKLYFLSCASSYFHLLSMLYVTGYIELQFTLQSSPKCAHLMTECLLDCHLGSLHCMSQTS